MFQIEYENETDVRGQMSESAMARHCAVILRPFQSAKSSWTCSRRDVQDIAWPKLREFRRAVSIARRPPVNKVSGLNLSCQDRAGDYSHLAFGQTKIRGHLPGPGYNAEIDARDIAKPAARLNCL